MPSSVVIFNVTKLRPGLHTITFASVIFIVDVNPLDREERNHGRNQFVPDPRPLTSRKLLAYSTTVGATAKSVVSRAARVRCLYGDNSPADQGNWVSRLQD